VCLRHRDADRSRGSLWALVAAATQDGRASRANAQVGRPKLQHGKICAGEHGPGPGGEVALVSGCWLPDGHGGDKVWGEGL
jgi:hypothetical protein